MNRKIFNIGAIVSILLVLIVITINTIRKSKTFPYYNTNIYAQIFPDYTNIEFPPNIAPLNFYIQEIGEIYYVEFGNKNKIYFTIKNKSGEIKIPISKWKKLISENIGDSVYVNIYVKNKERWFKFKTIKNFISPDSIDNYLAYRLINTGHELWNKMGLYIREISSFKEKPILENKLISNNCINCHNFYKNSTDKMIFHVRGSNKGTIIICNNKVKKIDTSTPYTMSAAVYPSWHPNGRIIAFSVNRINQSFHSFGEELIEVYDKASDLIIYDIVKNEISTCPQISTKGNETYPNWSPDGKYLYYCLAPKWSPEIPVDSFRYSLMRISFNPETREWGKIDTLISADKIKKSVSFPRVSPNGKYILLTLSNHGVFSIFYPSSDLYLFNLEKGELTKMFVNSNHVDSYHCWSSNGKWVVFSSKRMNKIHARPFFFHIDENGNTSKPFVLPAKCPHFYETFLKNYNIPELINQPLSIPSYKLSEKILQKSENVNFDPHVDIDALSGATFIKKKENN